MDSRLEHVSKLLADDDEWQRSVRTERTDNLACAMLAADRFDADTLDWLAVCAILLAAELRDDG
jgi:hypothetical protein